jgi:imidazolonepropionase-like amidohydrolase
VFLNFWPDVQDTRTPARFTAVAERGADLDLSSAPVRRFIDLLKERRVVIDPTLSIFEGMFTDRPGQMAAADAPVADRFPPFIRRSFLDGGLPRPAALDARYRRSFDAMLNMLRRLYDVGVPIVAGTDALAGFTLHRELELYVQAGIPAPAVLQLATLGAARVAGMADNTGSIVAGKLADLLVVEGDPTRVMSDIRRTRLVVKGGVLFEREAIDRALSTPATRR